MDLLLEPAGPELVVKEAARCLVATANRRRADVDIKAMLQIFAEELSGYPRDVIGEVFRRYARESAWAPTLSAIRELCEHHTRWRRSLARCLEASR